jgi:hypothetical protein
MNGGAIFLMTKQVKLFISFFVFNAQNRFLCSKYKWLKPLGRGFNYYNPRFKSWAMENIVNNRFNGL